MVGGRPRQEAELIMRIAAANPTHPARRRQPALDRIGPDRTGPRPRQGPRGRPATPQTASLALAGVGRESRPAIRQNARIIASAEDSGATVMARYLPSRRPYGQRQEMHC
jgi:hypothetical protein